MNIIIVLKPEPQVISVNRTVQYARQHITNKKAMNNFYKHVNNCQRHRKARFSKLYRSVYWTFSSSVAQTALRMLTSAHAQ